MSTPCFQHDSYRRDCGDCRDMNGDDEPRPIIPEQAMLVERCRNALNGLRDSQSFPIEEEGVVRVEVDLEALCDALTLANRLADHIEAQASLLNMMREALEAVYREERGCFRKVHEALATLKSQEK